MRERLKGLVSESSRRRLRKLGRLRWMTKAKVIKRSGVGLRDDPRTWLRYVLLDPEVDSFTYTIENVDELVAHLSRLTGIDAATLAAHAAEAQVDPELTTELSRRMRWRFDTKRRLPLVGHQLTAWTLTRALRPEAVVEAGILDGLGSLAVLRALERNREEGAPGTLVSFDVMPDAGHLVSDRLRAGWEPVYEDSRSGIPRVLRGRRVGLFISDSLPESDHVRGEIEAVLEHADDSIVILQAWGWLDAIYEVAREYGTTAEMFHERPAGHFYEGNRFALARIEPGRRGQSSP